jgi:hypothetical protein
MVLHLWAVKFSYCSECKELHPKNWYSGRSCERCNGTCAIIVVHASFVGYLMYFFSILGVVLIVIYLLGTKWSLSDYAVPLIFGAIIAGLVCSFIEIGRGTELAYERIRKKD